jgi:hypothetical protein
LNFNVKKRILLKATLKILKECVANKMLLFFIKPIAHCCFGTLLKNGNKNKK